MSASLFVFTKPLAKKPLVAMELGDDDEEAEDEDEDEEDGGVPYEVVEVIKKMQAGATSIE